MVQLVKAWPAQREDVRILTAHVNPHLQGDAHSARRAIEAWCKRHTGQILLVTYVKDWDLVLLLDDRARQVERDTGREELFADEFWCSPPTNLYRKANNS